MATADRVLALKLIAEVGEIKKPMAQVSDQVDKVGGKFDRFTKGLRGMGGRFKSMAKSVVSWGKALAGALLIKGVEMMTDAVQEGIKAFREEQDIIRNFRGTVRNMGLDAEVAARSMERMGDKAVNLGFDDAEAIKGLDELIKMTGSLGKANKIMALAMDIARSKQIPLTQALRIAQQVYAGSTRATRLYGIEGKKGMEAVDAARKKERGAAQRWAKNHPFLVTVGKINDVVADIVGNFSEGKWTKGFEAIGELGELIDEAIFGKKTKSGKRVKNSGIVDKLGGLAASLAQEISKRFGEVDWGKTLIDTLNAALGALKTAVENGTLGNLVLAGGAIATAMFVASLFKAAATKMFGLPGWGAKKIVGIAATVMGSGFSKAMWIAHMFLDQAATMFKGVTKLPARLLGALRTFGRLIGTPLGLGILAGIAAVFTANALLDFMADRLDETFGTKNFSKARREQRNHGADPLSMFGRVLEGLLGGGFAGGTSNAPPGWHWVGERGPELMRFRGGEQVIPHRQSMAMAGGGGVVINVSVAPTADKASIGREIIEAIKAAEARQGKGWRN